jgi:hypothetical protein
VTGLNPRVENIYFWILRINGLIILVGFVEYGFCGENLKNDVLTPKFLQVFDKTSASVDLDYSTLCGQWCPIYLLIYWIYIPDQQGDWCY